MKYAEYFFHFYLSAAEPNLGGGVAATDDSDDTPSTEVDSGLMQSPSSSKRVRLTSSMAKREMITFTWRRKTKMLISSTKMSWPFVRKRWN